MPKGKPKKKEGNKVDRIFETIIGFMSSRAFMFVFTLFALVPMVFHTQIVYLQHTVETNIFLAYTYAIVLDAATLVAVLRAKLNKSGIAWWAVLFATVSLGVNICFLFEVPAWVGRIIIAVMIPFTISFFSHEVARRKGRRTTITRN